MESLSLSLSSQQGMCVQMNGWVCSSHALFFQFGPRLVACNEEQMHVCVP